MLYKIASLIFIVHSWRIPEVLGNVETFPLLMPKILPKREESYICTPVRLSDDASFYVVGFEPNATQHTAHHMLIYGCSDPGSEEEVWNCGEMASTGYEDNTSPCATDPSIIYAWAKGAPELKLPEGVGFRVGKDTPIRYLVLQVHYAHLDKIPKTGDDSGVFLKFTKSYQPKEAGVLLLGTGGYAPPHSTTFFEATCNIDDDRVIHPFAFRTHTHGLGKVVSGWKVVPQKNWTWSLIGKKDPQKPQMFYPVEDPKMTLTNGDIIAARCTMVNNKDWNVYVGATNQDEMCNFYVMYWVEGNGGIVYPNTCFSQGPPHWSWRGWELGPRLQNIPDIEASQL